MIEHELEYSPTAVEHPGQILLEVSRRLWVVTTKPCAPNKSFSKDHK